jgi:hypothetical protein
MNAFFFEARVSLNGRSKGFIECEEARVKKQGFY